MNQNILISAICQVLSQANEILVNSLQKLLVANFDDVCVCASSNPPSVLSGIPLSGQPEQVQDFYALFGLAPLGSAVSFQF